MSALQQRVEVCEIPLAFSPFSTAYTEPSLHLGLPRPPDDDTGHCANAAGATACWTLLGVDARGNGKHS